MSRFDKEPDPVFWALNASLGFDRRLAPYDLRQSRAHAVRWSGSRFSTMPSSSSCSKASTGRGGARGGQFPFVDSDEDIHMAIERRLTEIVGRVGGKIHTGRSRNDQVATDLALFVAERGEVAIELIGDGSGPAARAGG